MIRTIFVALCVSLVFGDSPVLDAEVICHLPKLVGPCKASHLRYFFNDTSETCQEFYYGGCSGNANNFELIEECEFLCKPNLVTEEISWSSFVIEDRQGDEGNRHPEKEQEAEFNPKVDCHLKPETGPCRGAHMRFYFNRLHNRCEEFIYGGCDGNRNNFASVETCTSACSTEFIGVAPNFPTPDQNN